MPYLYQVLASELAGKVVMMAFVIPVSAVLAFVLHPELHVTLQGALLFIPSLFMAWWLRFLWGYALALLAFWATRADALLAIQDAMIFLLAGVMAPTTLLPDPLHLASVILPFRYMVGFPVELLMGQYSDSQIWIGLGIQFAWLVFTALITSRVWKTGLKRYSAIGG